MDRGNRAPFLGDLSGRFLGDGGRGGEVSLLGHNKMVVRNWGMTEASMLPPGPGPATEGDPETFGVHVGGADRFAGTGKKTKKLSCRNNMKITFLKSFPLKMKEKGQTRRGVVTEEQGNPPPPHWRGALGGLAGSVIYRVPR